MSKKKSATFLVLAMASCDISNREAAEAAHCNASHLSDSKHGTRPLPERVQKSLGKQLAAGVHLLPVRIPYERLRALAQTIYDEQQEASGATNSRG